ncbi:hypothetical protein [Actinokineospora inagensis]|uniref:hypothetical protein n=1 Tax=Actinokineospora inagensis TaxID=103730 RepID=UPI0012F9DCAB|nr:hypothetical protein [Actinokineospora inagensis]
MSTFDRGSTESGTDDASEAIRLEMEAGGHGRNYYAYGDMVFIHHLRDVIRSERISSSRLTDEMRYFVEPVGFRDALTKLTTHRIVVLCGPAESGRHTSALALIVELNLLRQRAVQPSPFWL